MNRLITAAAALAFVSLGLDTAISQDSTARTAKAVTGQRVQLSVHFNLKKDCSPSEAPEVRVITPPANGSLAIRAGTLRSAKVGNCSNIEGPARVVLYQSNRGFTGADRVDYEVKKAGGSTEVQSVTIHVLPAPTTPGVSKPKIDDI